MMFREITGSWRIVRARLPRWGKSWIRKWLPLPAWTVPLSGTVLNVNKGESGSMSGDSCFLCTVKAFLWQHRF